VADKYAWGKECNALALAKVKEMWNTSRLEVAPELYADFLARCITCEVAERSQFNRECYQVAAQHIKDIANHYPKELKLETYERFMRGCSASGVLTNELVIQDPVLLPYLKKILS
jgi:hypothetical protein